MSDRMAPGWAVGPAARFALVDPRARDYAARDFKRCLKAERRWKPASVNLALAALEHFDRFLGLGPANVKRDPLAQAAPRVLSRGAAAGVAAGGE